MWLSILISSIIIYTGLNNIAEKLDKKNKK